jgi:triacylglycerol esterase/lipase EstA (alpha/beta hydrolase family)
MRQLPLLSSPSTKRLLCALLVVILVIGAVGLVQAPRAFAYSSNGVPVIYVHGFNVNAGIPGGCNGSTNFGTIRNYLVNSGWTGYTISVKYYSNDQNCDQDLHALENYHCTGYYAGNEGTTSEDVRHLGCVLAWYIWDYFTSQGVAVKLIGHSMGGVIIRQALFDTPYVWDLPPYLTVEDVVTAGSPHQGLLSGAAFVFCGSCSSVAQMEQANDLMQNLNSSTYWGGSGRNPQGNTGTDWTTMASGNDFMLQQCAYPPDSLGGYVVNQAVLCGFIPGGFHLVNFWDPNYSHGDYLTDGSTAWNASADYSDNNGGNWYTAYQSYPHSIQNMWYAISSQNW